MSQYVVLGAGVVGLTTALELKARYPNAEVVLVAKYLPGDRSPDYTSPWAGANWLSVATDNGRQEEWDAVTFHKFQQLSKSTPEAGLTRMDIRVIFDSPPEKANVLSNHTGKIWYEELVGGLHHIPKDELPEGAHFGFNLSTFMVNVQAYIPWLQIEVYKSGIEVRRAYYDDIRELLASYPKAKAFFNCTGLGSYSLKGVEDKNVYPTRGQIMLVETPDKPVAQIYFRSPQRVANDTTYVIPRLPSGGVVLGGCRLDGVWDGEPDLEFAEDIKRRCCALCPALGKPEELKVIYHAVGLRPSRKGGPRIEREVIDDRTVVHNYGAGGAGYQASWGMAKEAVDLMNASARL